jgi:type IV secretion system protein VirD4
LLLGRTPGWPGTRHLLATEARHSVLVLGPTQSGKTSGLAVPALLEWSGPVIATSVKDDLASISLAWRARQGPCWVFDPTRSSGIRPLAGWTPLAGCGDWSSAQRMAGWLVEAAPARTGLADAAFWYAAAAKQLAPLLLAAARAEATMAEVVRWTNTAAFDEPRRLLEVLGEEGATVALAACEARDPRILSSVATTLETVLAPFEDPVVAASTAAAEIDLAELLLTAGSLYLCGPSHEQHRVQGLFAAVVSCAVAAAIQRVNEMGRPLAPPLLLVLDEAANIAPIRDLDILASTGAGMGIQLVTVCQDLAQLAYRYGTERSRTIANNHRAKLLLSGVSDLATLDLVSGLAGETALREDTFTYDLRDGRRTRSSAVAFRRLAPADELRRIRPGEGLLIYGHLPPVPLQLRPWYADRRLRGRASAVDARFLGPGTSEQLS